MKVNFQRKFSFLSALPLGFYLLSVDWFSLFVHVFSPHLIEFVMKKVRRVWLVLNKSVQNVSVISFIIVSLVKREEVSNDESDVSSDRIKTQWPNDAWTNWSTDVFNLVGEDRDGEKIDESMCRVRYEQCRCDVETSARNEEKRETMPSDKRRPVPSRTKKNSSAQYVESLTTSKSTQKKKKWKPQKFDRFSKRNSLFSVVNSPQMSFHFSSIIVFFSSRSDR